MSKLFEAFFWIEPERSDIRSGFSSSRVVWHYPDDVSDVSNEFRDIPQFCFPDLEKMKLEKAERCKNEYFTFTLTDSEGKRVYGVCLRSLFRGESRRHDVRRRPKHCLCIITRQPFFRLFRVILLEVHALGLLDPLGVSARSFIEMVYSQALTAQNALKTGSTSGINENASVTATATAAAVWSQIGKIIIARQALPELNRDFSLILPVQSAASISQNKEVPILPLLEVLGIEKFLLVLSAVMCERRIVFIADDVGTLSSSVLAAAAMLHPFNWQHVFIPLLPSKLLSYAAAPMPYLIGVRRYLTDRLGKEALDGVVIVDVDNGDCRVRGDVTVKDFVGESGSTMKQASENFDRVRKGASGVASMFARAVAGESFGDTSSIFADTGPKDMVASIVTELRGLLAVKPGSSSVVAVASGLFRNLPGGAKMTVEESKVIWSLESEKILRDVLLQFYVYLFADIEDFVLPSALSSSSSTSSLSSLSAAAASSVVSSTVVRSSKLAGGGGSSSSDQRFSEGDSRACFDLRAFQQRRAMMGDTPDLQEFVSEFLHSQMFERFCDEKLKKMKTAAAAAAATAVGGAGRASRKAQQSSSASTAASASGSVWSKAQGLPSSVTGSSATSYDDEDDDYDAVCGDIRKNKSQQQQQQQQQQTTVAVVKAAVAARAAVTAASLQIGGADAGTKGFVGLGFHPLVVQYTAGAGGGSSRDIISGEEQSDGSGGGGGGGVVVDRICQEANSSDAFSKIMHTIGLRLEGCRAALGRGSSGTAGVRALNLLRALLVCGPEGVLSAALDFIPVIRALLRNANKDKDGAAQAIEFMSLGAAVDVRPSANAVLSLLLDHRKLRKQRQYALRCRHGAYVHLLLEPRPTPLFSHPAYARLHKPLNDSLRKDLLPSGPFGSKQLPDISSLHESLRPSGVPSIDPTVLRLTTPVAASSEGREVDDDEPNQASQYESEESEKLPRSGKAVQPQYSSRPSPAGSLKTTATAAAAAAASSIAAGVGATATLLPLDSFEPVANPFEAFAPPGTISNSTESAKNATNNNNNRNTSAFSSSGNAPTTNLLDDIDEDAKYRIINRDTGEVMDLRDLENLFRSPSTTVAQTFATTPIKSRVPILAPPVQPALFNRTSPRSPLGKATDPFASVHVTAFSDPWASSFSSATTLIPNAFNGSSHQSGTAATAAQPPTAPTASSGTLDNLGFPVLQPTPAVSSSSGGGFVSFSSVSSSTSAFPSSSSSVLSSATTSTATNAVLPMTAPLIRGSSSNNPIHSQPASNPFAAFAPPPGPPMQGSTAATVAPIKTTLQPQRGLTPQTKDPFADLVGDLKK